MQKNLLILGASGQVGQHCLQQALEHAEVAQVVAPTRTPLLEHPKLINPLVDYEQLPADAPWWQADGVICALGTTLKLAGSQAAFRRVDHDYVMTAARLARQAGTPGFALNSSLGASVSASSFYLRVKGELERDLEELRFSWLTIVRPSLLDGGPRPDFRPGERIALAVSKSLGWLVPRSVRPVKTSVVAGALLHACLHPVEGVTAVESKELS